MQAREGVSLFQFRQYFRSETFLKFTLSPNIIWGLGKMEKAVFNEEKLIKILTRRKDQLKESQINILNKLKRKEKLTEKEFWSIFELIRQEGPK